MNRRQFVRTAALTGVASRLAARLGAMPQDASDRGPERDPLAIQRSTLVVDGLDPSALSEKYLEMLRAGGVDCWHISLDDLQSFADAWSFLDGHRDRIVLATSVKAIREAREQRKIALVLGLQSAEALGDTTRPPKSPLRAYYQLGLRILGIAYNVANYFGAGNLDPQLGLSRAGRRLVEQIHKLRIVLDVGGHTGEQTTLDAIAMSAGLPVICSHTNVAAIADNPRCVSDRVIDAIAGTGGVIGITAISEFIKRGRKDAGLQQTPQASLSDFLDQLEYVRKRAGVDAVALGPDFVEGQPRATEEGRNALLFPREMTGDWPWTYVKGFESISELPNVTRGLAERGWPTVDIRKVLGENWLRVYGRVWGA